MIQVSGEPVCNPCTRRSTVAMAVLMVDDVPLCLDHALAWALFRTLDEEAEIHAILRAGGWDA